MRRNLSCYHGKSRRVSRKSRYARAECQNVLRQRDHDQEKEPCLRRGKEIDETPSEDKLVGDQQTASIYRHSYEPPWMIQQKSKRFIDTRGFGYDFRENPTSIESISSAMGSLDHYLTAPHIVNRRLETRRWK